MHVSVHEDVDAIREARGRGQPVYGYGETLPHYAYWWIPSRPSSTGWTGSTFHAEDVTKLLQLLMVHVQALGDRLHRLTPTLEHQPCRYSPPSPSGPSGPTTRTHARQSPPA